MNYICPELENISGEQALLQLCDIKYSQIPEYDTMTGRYKEILFNFTQKKRDVYYYGNEGLINYLNSYDYKNLSKTIAQLASQLSITIDNSSGLTNSFYWNFSKSYDINSGCFYTVLYEDGSIGLFKPYRTGTFAGNIFISQIHSQTEKLQTDFDYFGESGNDYYVNVNTEKTIPVLIDSTVKTAILNKSKSYNNIITFQSSNDYSCGQWVQYLTNSYVILSRVRITTNDITTDYIYTAVKECNETYSFVGGNITPYHAIYSSVSLTAGSVLFADSNGNIAQDNANLFWDDANNSLGIGMTPNAWCALSITAHLSGSTAQGISVLSNIADNTNYGVWIDTSGSGTAGNYSLILDAYNGSVNRALWVKHGSIYIEPLTASQAVFTDASKNLVSKNITGSGDVVLATTPTFITSIITPVLYGGAASGDDLYLRSTSHGTKGVISIADDGGCIGIGSVSVKQPYGFQMEYTGGAGGFITTSSTNRFMANVYYDGSNKYIGSGKACQIQCEGSSGDFAVYTTDTTGAADDACSMTEKMRVKSNGRVNMSSLPTSASGLSAGDLWNNGGVVNIV